MTDLRTRVLGLLRPHVAGIARSTLANDIVTAAEICESAELASLRGDVETGERKVHELRKATVALAADKANAEYEARSLRGVVQAVEALPEKIRDIAETWLYHGDGDRPVNDGYYRLLDLADSLDAAAVPSQPEPETPDPGREWVRCGNNAFAWHRRSVVCSAPHWTEPQAQPADPPTCEHGATGPHRMVNAAANFGCAAIDCAGPSPAGLPEPGKANE